MSTRFILVEAPFGTGIVERGPGSLTASGPTVIIRDRQFAEAMAKSLARSSAHRDHEG